MGHVAASGSIVRRLNILEIVGNAIVGGMETYVAHLISHLPQDGFNVFCVCPFESRFTARLRSLGCQVFVTPVTDDPSWASLQSVTSLANSHAIDVIHAHLPNAHLLGAIVGKFVDTPVLATVHGRTLSLMDLEVHRSTGTHLSVVCQSAYLNALMHGIRSDRLHLVANGVDCDTFQPRQGSSFLQRALGLARQTRLVGFVGRLSPEKGPEVFLRAAWLVRQSCPDVHFVFVGNGPLLGKLTTTARHMGAGDWLHFAGELTDMPQVYGSLDVVVSTSHAEGMPLVLMEAMACGVPVVATHVGGVAELVVVGETGFLARAGDYEGIAESTTRLLVEPGLRDAMGAAGRLRAEEKFSLVKSVAEMAGVLTTLAGAAHGIRMTGLSSVDAQGTVATRG